VVDLGRHSEAALMAAEGNTFPLIIRLETVTDRGAKEGHSLKVGCPSLALFRVLYFCRSSGGRRHGPRRQGGPQPQGRWCNSGCL